MHQRPNLGLLGIISSCVWAAWQVREQTSTFLQLACSTKHNVWPVLLYFITTINVALVDQTPVLCMCPSLAGCRQQQDRQMEALDQQDKVVNCRDQLALE